MVLLSLFFAIRLGGIAEGKSLSSRKGVCKGKGYRFCREGLARYACPSLIACRGFERRSRRGRYLEKKRRLNTFSRHHILISPATPVFNSNPSLSAKGRCSDSASLRFLFVGGIGEICLHKCRLQTKKTTELCSVVRCSKSALCGKRGIRTPGTVARTPHFECGPFDHSGIFPRSTASYRGPNGLQK